MKKRFIYLFHFVFDVVVYLLIRKYFGFEIAILIALASMGVDIVKGFQGFFKEVKNES